MASAALNAPQQDENILFFLRETMGLPVTKENLHKPTPTFVRTVFERFLNDVYIDRAATDTPVMGAAAIFRHYEVAEEAIPLVNLVMFMKPFMETFNVRDFGIADIIDPKPKRTRRLLSHLLLFWKYAADKMAELHMADLEQKEKEEHRKQLQMEKENLEKRIQEMKAEMEELQNKKEPVMKRIQETCQEVASVTETMKVLTEFYQDLKQETARAEENMQEELDGIRNREEILHNLKLPVLRSNESLATKLEELNERHQSLVQKRNMMSAKELQMTKDANQKRALMAEVLNTQKVIERASETLDKLKEFDAALQDVKAQREQADEGLSSTNAKLNKELEAHEKEMECLKKEIQLEQRHNDELKLSINDSKKYLNKLRESAIEKEKALSNIVQETQALQDQVSSWEKKSEDYSECVRKTAEKLIKNRTEMQAKAEKTLETIEKGIDNILKVAPFLQKP